VKHILLVDDDHAIVQLLTRALKAYDVSVAHDGIEALALASDRQPDLLITDYSMPEMTGDELITRLREQQPSLKALIITGHGETLDRTSPDWWRRERHLAKPFRIEALREAVTTLLELA
jgi:CheY-like chemotaxis protein